MARRKRFKVELVLLDADGQACDLAGDLKTDGAKRLPRLDRLTEDFLDEAQPMQWPASREGAWIYVPLANDIAICQWHPGAKALWDLGFAVGNSKSLESLPKAIFSASWNEPRCLTRVLTQDMRVDAQHHGWVGMAEAGCVNEKRPDARSGRADVVGLVGVTCENGGCRSRSDLGERRSVDGRMWLPVADPDRGYDCCEMPGDSHGGQVAKD